MTTEENMQTSAVAAAPSAKSVPRQIVIVPLDKLDESPTNPRKTFRGLEELAASFREHGVLEPILARPKGTNGSTRYEIIFGARRYRAAKLAKLEGIETMLCAYSDKEVLEKQLIENLQREDVDAVEEADGFQALHLKHGYSAEDLAAKITKSVAYVYARLKLCALGPEARAALSKGALTPSTALYVARVPPPLQKDAVKDLAPRESGDPLGAREAFAIINSKYMLRLADAPFDRADATLVPKAGACAQCPKRSGNQPALFADVKAADTCTDPTCFGAKRDAAWERQKAKASADGIDVLEGKRAKEVFPWPGGGVSHSSGFVDLDAKDYTDQKNRTYRERYGKKLEEAPRALVRDDRKQVHELVDVKAIKRLQPKARTASGGSSSRAPETSQADKLKRLSVVAGNRAALAILVEKVEKRELDKAMLRILVAREMSVNSGTGDAARRRGWIGEDDDVHGAKLKMVEAEIDKLNADGLRGLLVELMLGEDVEFGPMADLEQAFAVMKIDAKQLVAKELARLKSEAKAPKPAPATPEAPKAKAKKKASKK
jgi:ParB/RepB/Spo0J family partition protein